MNAYMLLARRKKELREVETRVGFGGKGRKNWSRLRL